MKRKILAVALALAMCFPLTMSITAYDCTDDNLSCCLDHDAWYIYYDLGRIDLDVEIVSMSNCIHILTNIGSQLFSSNQINDHWVPASGGSGATVYCRIFLDTFRQRLRCTRTGCGQLFWGDITSQVTRHTFC
jgi:hypothetical protein